MAERAIKEPRELLGTRKRGMIMYGYSKAAENYRRKILGVIRAYKKAEKAALIAVVATLMALKKDKNMRPSEKAHLIGDLHQRRDGWELLEAAFMIVNDTRNAFNVQNMIPYLSCIHHLLAVNKPVPTMIDGVILQRVDARGQRRLYTQNKFSVAACIVNDIKLPVMGKAIPIEDIIKDSFLSAVSDASLWKTFNEMNEKEKAWFVTEVDKRHLDFRGDRYGKFHNCQEAEYRKAYVVEMDKTLMLPYCIQSNQFVIVRDGSKDMREVIDFSNGGKRKLHFLLANSSQAKRARSLKNIARVDKVLKKMTTRSKGVRFVSPAKTYKHKRINKNITWK
jgi:hypothetical protein